MRVLVLGAYGLIGLAVAKRLIAGGHSLVGLARSARRGRALLPEADWIGADISALTTPEDWKVHLKEIDAVVNASGALQSGLKDNVAAVQRDAIIALISACEATSVTRFIQISAPGASEMSDTAFYATKGAADAALKDSRLNWTIFRPGLVLARQAYGGTSLVRTLAAIPLVQPLVLANTPIQTVAVDDVADAVATALQTDLSGQDLDLVAPTPTSLSGLVLAMRRWLGFSRPRAVLALPLWIGRINALLGDLAGWLGWRPALRTSALKVLAKGVTGDPAPWQALAGKPTRTLAETLSETPATTQDRLHARAMLAFPFLLVLLSAFWIASGLIGLARHDAATAVLGDGLPAAFADIAVRTGSVIDIAIGALMLLRPTTRLACLASILVAAGYLIASALLTPALWADPLGPMVKVFPAIGLAVIVATLSQER